MSTRSEDAQKIIDRRAGSGWADRKPLTIAEAATLALSSANRAYQAMGQHSIIARARREPTPDAIEKTTKVLRHPGVFVSPGVIDHYLQLVGDDPIGQWARNRLKSPGPKKASRAMLAKLASSGVMKTVERGGRKVKPPRAARFRVQQASAG